MSGSDKARIKEQVRQHLLFLQEMGVREIDVSLSEAAAPGPTEAIPSAIPDSDPAATPRAAVASPRDLFSADEPLEETRAMSPGLPSAAGLFCAEPLPSGALPAGEASALLERLRTETVGDCRRCKLCEGRTTIVFGDGSPTARVMFVGEGPGSEEDRRGLPFVGRAGHLLDQIIQAMGFGREQVYIANVVKCRPPENRTPQPDEVAACTPFLFEQIAIIRPKVIVALGSPAVQALLGRTSGITKIRGTFHEYRGIRVMPTFHPAYLLRNPAAKRPVWEDMKKVMAYLQEG